MSQSIYMRRSTLAFRITDKYHIINGFFPSFFFFAFYCYYFSLSIRFEYVTSHLTLEPTFIVCTFFASIRIWLNDDGCVCVCVCWLFMWGRRLLGVPVPSVYICIYGVGGRYERMNGLFANCGAVWQAQPSKGALCTIQLILVKC